MENIELYHGSKGGIVGEIQPVSRLRCDFGRGFYLGTVKEQAQALISDDQQPVFYTVELALSEIPDSRILTLEGEEWAYFVLFNRGKLDQIKGSPMYKKYANLAAGKDVIIGPIADDNMNLAMRRFVNNEITDTVLLESLRYIDYGVQYVLKTEEACRKVKVLSETELSDKQLAAIQPYMAARRHKGDSIVKKMERRYRREGRYFDEIMGDYIPKVGKGQGSKQ